MAIQFVGRILSGKAGSTSAVNTLDLTALTGGIAAAAANGDLVIAVAVTADIVDRTLSITDGTTEYTLIGTELYSDSVLDTNLRVAYKFMGATPDTTVSFGPSGGALAGLAIAAFVFRGVDQTTPLDVTVQTATGTGTTAANPPSITPTTEGAIVVAIGGGASSGVTPAALTSAYLSGFGSQAANDSRSGTYHPVVAGGYKTWTSGAIDTPQFGGGVSSADYSWAALALALRPIPPVTKTASVNGVLKKVGITKTASANGLVKRQGVTAAATANGVIKTVNSVLTSLDGVLQKVFTKAVSASGVLRKPGTVNASASGVFRKQFLTNLSANAIIIKDGWVVDSNASPNSWNPDGAASGGWTPESAVSGTWS